MSRKQTEDVANSAPVPKGVLVIIGGKEEKETPIENNEEGRREKPEILQRFIEAIGKKDPIIEVISTASSVPDEMIEDYKKAFGEMNIHRVGHIHHYSRKEIINDNLEERVNQADAFFFTGGDQLLLTSVYGGTPFLTNLKQRYIYEQVVIAGTSAGAMALSTPMIYAGNKEVQQTTGGIKVTMGLEFLKDVCIDTHFINRNRFIRMAQVVASNPTCIGLGIEEDTAVIITEGRKATVIGHGVVTIVEGFDITATNITEFSKDKKISIQDLKVHLLPKDAVYYIPQINPPHC